MSRGGRSQSLTTAVADVAVTKLSSAGVREEQAGRAARARSLTITDVKGKLANHARSTPSSHISKEADSMLFLKKTRLHDGHGAGSEAQDVLTMPVLGHKDWEEKRHQLLLQKMQLEVERERLQVRLAQQEERLSRQNQQLQQARLQSNRCCGERRGFLPSSRQFSR